MRGLVLFTIAAIAAGLAPLISGAAPLALSADFPGWPTVIDGHPLTPVPLQDYEQRFATALPGRLAKFSDGTREYMLQWIAADTRLIHPATDCLANAGFQITPQPLWVDDSGNRWSSSLATRGDRAVRVRERIFNDAKQEWQDVSAWYWSVLLHRTRGPWWVITVVEPVDAAIVGK